MLKVLKVKHSEYSMCKKTKTLQKVFDHQVCQNPTFSHALTDILTLVLNKTLMNGDKNKQPRLKWCFEIR